MNDEPIWIVPFWYWQFLKAISPPSQETEWEIDGIKVVLIKTDEVKE